MREKAGLLLSIFMPTFVFEKEVIWGLFGSLWGDFALPLYVGNLRTYPVQRGEAHGYLIFYTMSKQKLVNKEQTSTGAVEEKEKSESARCRETIAAIYAAQAYQIFVGIACKTFHKTETQFVSEDDVNDVLSKVTTDDGATVWVYTQPSEEPAADSDLLSVPKSWNKVLPIGQRWYKKAVAVTDAFVLLRAYSNYLRFKEDGDKALLRSAKKAVANMTQEELVAFVLEQQKKAQQTDNNGKQD